MNIKRTISIKQSYKYYVCNKCGKKIIPMGNPSRCPNCGHVAHLK